MTCQFRQGCVKHGSLNVALNLEVFEVAWREARLLELLLCISFLPSRLGNAVLSSS